MYTCTCKLFVKLKKGNKKVNTTVGSPLLPIKPLHKTSRLTNLRGGGGSEPPSGSTLVSHGMCGTLCIDRELNKYIPHVNYKKSFSLL